MWRLRKKAVRGGGSGSEMEQGDRRSFLVDITRVADLAVRLVPSTRNAEQSGAVLGQRPFRTASLHYGVGKIGQEPGWPADRLRKKSRAGGRPRHLGSQLFGVPHREVDDQRRGGAGRGRPRNGGY